MSPKEIFWISQSERFFDYKLKKNTMQVGMGTKNMQDDKYSRKYYSNKNIHKIIIGYEDQGYKKNISSAKLERKWLYHPLEVGQEYETNFGSFFGNQIVFVHKHTW